MSENRKRTLVSKHVAGVLAFCLSGSALFSGDVASLQKSETGVFWVPNDGLQSFHLTVVGPKGFRIDKTCDTTDISITEFGTDGLYKYELTANKTMQKRLRVTAEERNSLEQTLSGKGGGLRDSGHFRVIDGHPVVDNVKEK